MSPSFEHEQASGTLALLVQVVASELVRDAVSVGSTTFKREDLQRGFEPDASFYIEHAGPVRGRRQIDLAVDPPPDLLIEIVGSRSSINILALYAQMGVPEVWRFDGNEVAIHALEAGIYRQTEYSVVLPPLSSRVLLRFLDERQSSSLPVWMRALKAWVHEQDATDDAAR